MYKTSEPDPRNDMGHCKDCRYCKDHGDFHNDWVLCRKRSPKANKQMNISTRWPIVCRDEWCGEFKERKAVSDEG